MKTQKPKIGRPPLPKKLQKGTLLSVRFSEDERAAMDHKAKQEELTLSEWARGVLVRAAQAS